MTDRPAKRAKTDSPVPITLLSGFLGAGKTTLLKQILENKSGLRVGVIVNDLAEPLSTIDASLIAVKSGEESGGSVDAVELTNGCACCSAAEELTISIGELLVIVLLAVDLLRNIQ